MQVIIFNRQPEGNTETAKQVFPQVTIYKQFEEVSQTGTTNTLQYNLVSSPSIQLFIH